MGALTRARDWSASPLGPPETWPQSLRTAVRILLNTNHPMFIWWGPQLIQFYNDAYRQTMGPERHPSALGQRGRECWGEIWHIIGPQIEQVMSGGGATWHENQLVPVTRHGRLEQVYWTYGYSPIDEDDGVGGVLVVCRDVTNDYLAAAALREREAELARVQQIGRIGGLEVDLRTGFRNRRSPEYLLIHGLPPDAAQESHEDWVRRIHPEDREATEKKFRDAVAGDVREYSVQYRIVRPSDGETRWISVKSTIERDGQGKAIRLVGAHTDVTEQVMAEQALRQSEERYRKLADQLADLNATLAQRVEEKTRERDRIWNVSQDLLVVADRNGVWQTVNPAWTRTLGWSEAELLNRTSEWLEHPDDNGITRAQVEKLGTTGTTVRFESRFRHRDGSYRWLSWTGVSDQDRNYAVARDVTAEKAAAERLRATEEALLQSQKMEAVGQLTGGIAHDFNNLLTGIVGSLDLLQTRLNQGRTENVARYIDAAMTSANRAAALTHRLLAFARRQPLIPKSVDVNRLVVSLEDLLRRTIGETIDLEIAAADDLWWTLCDPNQLESALLNLAINAPRRHAGWRQAHHLDRQCAHRPRDRGDAHALARRLYLHRGHRYRRRHERGSGGACLRSVLYHQADRAGHRTWAFDDLRICAAIERPCHHRQQIGAGDFGQALSAASSWRRRGPADLGRQGGRTCRHRRDRAGGRGRARGARRDPGDARRTGLPVAAGRRWTIGLENPAQRRADRSAGHRCRPARHQRPPARRSGAGNAARI